jgi:hypothetical protein
MKANKRKPVANRAKRTKFSNDDLKLISESNQRWFDRNLKIGSLLIVGNIGVILFAETLSRTKQFGEIYIEPTKNLIIGFTIAAMAIFLAKVYSDDLTVAIYRKMLGRSNKQSADIDDLLVGKYRFSTLGVINAILIGAFILSAMCITAAVWYISGATDGLLGVKK